MSRRVLTGSSGRTDEPPSPPQPNRDDFLSRLVKYIPAEIVGLYVAVRGVIPEGTAAAVMWYVALAAWILVPVYFFFVTTRGGFKPMIQQIIFGTIAFPIWVFAIGGSPVTSWDWFNHHQYVASIVLIFVTVVFGWLEPPPGS